MYGQQGFQAINEGNTGHFNLSCLGRVDRMCNRKEEGEKERYFIAFRYALFYVISAIPAEQRLALLNDFSKLEILIQEIKNNPYLNDASKKEKITELKYDFADKHEYHIFTSFSRVGILNISDDGVIDFEKHDVAALKRIARNDAGKARIKFVSGQEEARKIRNKAKEAGDPSDDGGDGLDKLESEGEEDEDADLPEEVEGDRPGYKGNSMLVDLSGDD